MDSISGKEGGLALLLLRGGARVIVTLDVVRSPVSQPLWLVTQTRVGHHSGLQAFERILRFQHFSALGSVSGHWMPILWILVYLYVLH